MRVAPLALNAPLGSAACRADGATGVDGAFPVMLAGCRGFLVDGALSFWTQDQAGCRQQTPASPSHPYPPALIRRYARTRGRSDPLVQSGRLLDKPIPVGLRGCQFCRGEYRRITDPFSLQQVGEIGVEDGPAIGKRLDRAGTRGDRGPVVPGELRGGGGLLRGLLCRLKLFLKIVEFAGEEGQLPRQLRDQLLDDYAEKA